MGEGVDEMNNTDMQAAASAIRCMHCMLKEMDCLTAEVELLDGSTMRPTASLMMQLARLFECDVEDLMREA